MRRISEKCGIYAVGGKSGFKAELVEHADDMEKAVARASELDEGSGRVHVVAAPYRGPTGVVKYIRKRRTAMNRKFKKGDRVVIKFGLEGTRFIVTITNGPRRPTDDEREYMRGDVYDYKAGRDRGTVALSHIVGKEKRT